MSKPVVLITGALTGIGRAAALAFAKQGARVVVSGRRPEVGAALAVELRALGSEAEFIQADVTRDEDVRNLVDKTVARFGRLDAAVNNAGTEGQPGPVQDQTVASYAATFDTNVLGTLLSMKHQLRVMQAQGSSSIVNISSSYGHVGAAGASVHQWLMQKRIERAKVLLKRHDLELSDIALICGFVDQSHFTRVFTRLERNSPGKWRRLATE